MVREVSGEEKLSVLRKRRRRRRRRRRRGRKRREEKEKKFLRAHGPIEGGTRDPRGPKKIHVSLMM